MKCARVSGVPNFPLFRFRFKFVLSRFSTYPQTYALNCGIQLSVCPQVCKANLTFKPPTFCGAGLIDRLISICMLIKVIPGASLYLGIRGLFSFDFALLAT